MTKDRLAELQNKAEDEVHNDSDEIYIEEPNFARIVDIDDILREMDEIRGWINDVSTNTYLIRGLHSDNTYYTNRNLQEQLDAAVTKTNGIGLKICGALRHFEMRKSYIIHDVCKRVARIQYATTRALYVDALIVHYAQLQEIRDTPLPLLQCQDKPSNVTVKDEREALLDSNTQAQTQEARQAYDDVREVYDLFMQMTRLVADQQESVDTVEYYANQITVQSEGQELQIEKDSQTRARQKKKILIICLIFGFLIVLIITGVIVYI